MKLAQILIAISMLLAGAIAPMDINAQVKRLGSNINRSDNPQKNFLKGHADHPEPDRGYRLILNKRFLPPDFDQETFDQVWKVWPEELQKKASTSSPAERRKMAFRRYGLTPRPDDSAKPMQYAIDSKGIWSLNCFSCHSGHVYDDRVSYPGLPNNRISLETLYHDMRLIKPKIGKRLSYMDVGSAVIPMGTTVGTSNAVIFGVGLMAFRDKDINLKSFVVPPVTLHHDMDAPPWWNYSRKKMLYIDGFTEKHHRALMPFIMVRQNDGKKFRSFENDFRHIQAYINTIRPPRFPDPIDMALSRAGKKIFQKRCAECHGSYESKRTYPERRIPYDEVGTDRVRLNALTVGHRHRYGKSWLTEYGKAKTVEDPGGYVAPPLDGIWSTAPYFHNGSVPTLFDVIQPSSRPVVWYRSSDGMDKQKVGLKVRTWKSDEQANLSRLPERFLFRTSRKGKSNSGHDFGESLSEKQSFQLLEYLKTL